MTLISCAGHMLMESYTKLYKEICSKENLELAWKKARKRKTLKPYVIEFENPGKSKDFLSPKNPKNFLGNLKENLLQLQADLIFHSYRPKPLETFILRDPKTRKISVSNFRDRIVHHAIINILEPIFEKKFIHDSYANRKCKGTLKAILRLKQFMNKVSRNGTIVNKYTKRNIRGFFFKGDIRHYFETVSHTKLVEVINKTIKDKELLFLIKNILNNYNPKLGNIGMPLGNLTSQFFANVYLNELDKFVKHELKIKYYIRYVDDFVILHNDKNKLEFYKKEISAFLIQNLSLELNIDKSKIEPLSRGIDFLGFRNFYYHKLLRKRNIRKVYKKLNKLKKDYDLGLINYNFVYVALQGWMAFVSNADTYNLRQRIIKFIDKNFEGEISTIEINKLIKFFNKS